MSGEALSLKKQISEANQISTQISKGVEFN